jgi:hypothetical protein
MTFEAVGVTTLFLTHFSPETQFLEAFGFDAFANVFEGSFFGFWHSKLIIQLIIQLINECIVRWKKERNQVIDR